jgi:hypothetical protein
VQLLVIRAVLRFQLAALRAQLFALFEARASKSTATLLAIRKRLREMPAYVHRKLLVVLRTAAVAQKAPR